ncbi:23S rRNA pseudouridine1911/1915/1917 synthase [Lactobacillus colini]|uniref:RNA pseudouridylate synthase n=1 Tax=Lactobacillus colini TaxID=1819254 RepID=A0ABS4MD54_9LACO|nr:RluA family pseudouridine synthase [Lactobacillus colini]MBP2057620.1 23S rRNA pseudouridine1911/1915/1917 synthase [Lactobacillus colini]
MHYFKLIFTHKTPQNLGRFLLKSGFSKRTITNSNQHGGMIFVNHKRRYTNYLLHEGDEVVFMLGKEKENQYLKPSDKPIDIVLEERDYLIVNKPAGILSIPSRYEDDDALVNRTLHYFIKQGLNGSKPHVVTRLDRDTSGLVLIGKNPVAQARFSRLGKDNLIKKYHAIVHGNFTDDELSGRINKPIGKKDDSVKRYIIASGQQSITDYQVVAQKSGSALVELRLLTGRTHQIRVHMQSIGHPLYGDPLYGLVDQFNRQALNCYLLEYQDPFTNQNKRISISDPEDMLNLWKNI